MMMMIIIIIITIMKVTTDDSNNSGAGRATDAVKSKEDAAMYCTPLWLYASNFTKSNNHTVRGLVPAAPH